VAASLVAILLTASPTSLARAESTSASPASSPASVAALRISPQAAAIYEEAVDLIASGALSDAASRLEEVIELEPGFALAHYNLGYVREATGDLAAAAQSYGRAVELEPEDLTARLALAGVYQLAGDYEAALPHYRATTEAAPTHPRGWLGLVSVLDAMGESQEAELAARRAVELLPADADIGYALAQIECRRVGTDPDSAETALRRALELDPEHPSAHLAHFQLGQLLYREERYEEAAAAYRSAAELRSDFAEAYAGLGQAAARTGDVDAAIAVYRRAIELKAPARYGGGHFNLAVLYEKRQDYEEALVHYRAAVADPDFEGAARAHEQIRTIELYLARKQRQSGTDE
jgi:tetratricopeptide (TPR) repeat protein